MTENKYDVLTVGDPTLDLIFTGMPQLPTLGEDTLASGFDMTPGEAYNTAVGLHRLGLKVAWVAEFGNDLISQLVLSLIRRDNMDETFFVHHNRPFRRISASFSYSNDRGFLSYYDPAPLIPSAISALTKVQAKCFFIPGLYTNSLFSLALPIIRAKKMILAMDGNCNSSINLHDKAVRFTISHLDLFMPNQKEALMLTGQTDLEAAGEELGKYCPLIIIKAGKDGAYAFHDKQCFHEPALKITPLDTTGAGDIFNSGFLTAWLEKKSLPECLRWGNISAGLSTLGHGSSGYRFTRTEIRDYISHLQTEN